MDRNSTSRAQEVKVAVVRKSAIIRRTPLDMSLRKGCCDVQ